MGFLNIYRAILQAGLLYVETAPFIYFTERHAAYVEKMRAFFKAVDQDQLEVVTSTITLPETLIKPIHQSNTILIKRYRTMFFNTKGVSLHSVTPTVGNIAAELRARYNLRTPDAIHLATAIETDCDAFLTNDSQLKRVKEVTVWVLDDLAV